MTSGTAARLHQGDCIHLAGDPSSQDQLYQVIGLDPHHDRCWLRRWPLARHGSPVFEMSLRQVQARGHRRHLPGSLAHAGLAEPLG
jgi:hypothetical protein